MADIEVRPVEPFEYDTWDSFVAGCSGGTIYHTTLWKRLLDSSYGHGEYRIIAAFGPDGILGGFCALVRNRIGVATAVTPLLTPYTGYLLPGPGDRLTGQVSSASVDTAHILLTLANYTAQFRYQSLQCGPRLPLISGLTEAGYQLTPRVTLEINLQLPEEELWTSFKGQVRRNIKKAQRHDFEITDHWDPAQGYELFRQTFARHDEECPVNELFFTEMTTGTLLSDHRRRFCAWADGVLSAYVITLEHNGTVYYQLAAADPKALSAGVSSLLIWNLLRAHKASGATRFDFVGANTPSIARFKEGFAPVAVPFVQTDLCKSKRILISRGARAWISKRGK